MTDAAGSFAFYVCPNPDCKARIKIYSRSFAGLGKNCPKCKIHISNVMWSKKEKRWISNQLKLHRNQKDTGVRK